jgi:Ca2+ transporting ATPase
LKELLDEENPPTPLQTKLEAVAEDIGKLGTLVAVLTFLSLMVHLAIALIEEQ